jgi:3-hydroxyacyl-[acyl-carrier-protein] dehydratase
LKLEYFAMLDRIVARDAESLVAEATLPDESPIFEGHFPKLKKIQMAVNVL